MIEFFERYRYLIGLFVLGQVGFLLALRAILSSRSASPVPAPAPTPEPANGFTIPPGGALDLQLTAIREAGRGMQQAIDSSIQIANELARGQREQEELLRRSPYVFRSTTVTLESSSTRRVFRRDLLEQVPEIRRWERGARRHGLFDVADYYRQWADALDAGHSPLDGYWNALLPEWVDPPTERLMLALYDVPHFDIPLH